MILEEETDTILRFGTTNGDHIEFMWGRGLGVECNSDWSGDSISGFGERLSMSIDEDQARHLHKWLGDRLTRKEG